MGGGDALVCSLCAVLVLAEVAAWTVDLDAVRQFFDNQKKHDEYQLLMNNYYGDEFDEYDGAPEGPRTQYAEEYGYEGYMERKVHGVVRKGGKYLDGLRLALENYKQTLENCSTLQLNQVDLGNLTSFPSINGSAAAGQNTNSQWPQILNLTAPMTSSSEARNLSQLELQRVRCANATREREHVRRLVDLALYTTRQLQDRAMKEMIYAGHPGHDGEERELIIRLAWFLDRLAHITGYEPEAKSFVDETEKTSSTTSAPVNPLAAPVPEDIKRQMIECVKKNSSIPATLRCSFPFQLPPILMMALNMTGNNITSTNSTSVDLQQALTEILTNAGKPAQPPIDPEKQASNLLETLLIVTDMWSKQPSSRRPARSVRKRSLDDPVRQFVDYYIKQKAWIGANARSNGEKETNENDYSVNNDLLKSITKRSEPMNLRFLLRMPKDQRHKVSHGKYKSGAHKASGSKLSKYLTKIRSALSGKGIERKIEKPHGHHYRSISKRAVVREAEDPMQDISYYVKNKPGTNIVPSLEQQLRVRLALERIFQTGSIEVVRRYGANYNPLVPSTFILGNIKTIADI